MRPDQVSRTARLVAACRALATERADRICDDPFARRFAGDEALAEAEAMPALVTGVAARTRYLDDAIVAFARRHAGAQIVILGAGLDSRALRLDVAAEFFELDLPAMLEYKREALGALPSRLHPVAHDLARGEWIPIVRAHAAYRADAPTCVVWEGVTYYLDERAVDSTLAQIAALIPSGDAGLFLFDWVRRAWVARSREVSPIAGRVAEWEEPLIFGFDDVGAALARHGLALIEEIACEDLLPRWGFPPVGERWYVGRMATARR